MNFGERLKAERKRLGYTGTEWAHLCGLGGSSTQSQYETGKTTPTPAYIERCCELGMDAHFLMTGERTLPALIVSEEVAEFIVALEGLSPKARKAIRALAAALREDNER